MADYDAIIIGAGHNGLVAGSVLARNGLRVACLEQTNAVGGMAASKQLFKGFRHSVGAWALILFQEAMEEALELHKYGYEVITPRTSFNSFGEPGDVPFVAYNDEMEMANHLMNDHGPETLARVTAMFEFMQTFGSAVGDLWKRAPEPIESVIARAPDERTREVLALCFYGSCMDIIRRFFPDPSMDRCIQASMCAMTIDGTHMGPYSPGTGMSMVYHYTVGGIANRFRMVKGGIGNLSKALARAFEAHGGEIVYKAQVRRIIIEDGRATGVELRNGDTLSSRVVLSRIDANKTFLHLVGEEHCPSDFVHSVKEIDYRNGYVQIHLTLSGLPEFTGHMSYINEGNMRWIASYIPSPEYLNRCWQQYRKGEVPDHPVSYYHIPSLLDPSAAPEGYHACTFFSHYFPCDVPEDRHQDLANEMADRVIAEMARFAPNFPEIIVDRVVLTQRYFEKAFGITAGDFCHGLLHPGQMWNRRPVAGWSDYRTPVTNLYMCGSACHPGPGVTGIPGYNGARRVLGDLEGSSAAA